MSPCEDSLHCCLGPAKSEVLILRVASEGSNSSETLACETIRLIARPGA